MSTQEILWAFNTMIANLTDAGEHDAAAQAEVLREWFTNPEFKDALATYSFAINSAFKS